MLDPRLLGTFLLAMMFGCSSVTPVNPSFPISSVQARRVIAADIAAPRPLKRPLLIIGGFLDPGFAQLILTRDFRDYFHDDRIIGVSLGFSFSEDAYKAAIISAVDKAFPTTDPVYTTEVDAIGYSMGGLAARYAAINPAPGRRLKIARLFTISSPHRGALSASRAPNTNIQLQKQMMPGSKFLNSINDSPDPGRIFPIYSYVVLNDRVVGAGNAAPPGQTPWWVSAPAFISAHNWALWDPRIRADILCRLRDDAPLSHDPPAPLPTQLLDSPPR